MLLKSKEMASQISDTISANVTGWKSKGILPTMATLLVKGDPASEYYAKAKGKMASKLGIGFKLISFDNDVTEEELMKEMELLNNNPNIHGIMLELPLPKHINTKKLSDTLSSIKDVDGISSANKWACMSGDDGLYPATPQACIRILKHFQFPMKGKNVVLVGRGETVGRPLIHLLLRENATLTVCHSHTQDLISHIKRADILITAVGQLGLITPEMVNPELVVIDAGINETANGIIGDVASEVSNFIKAMTPVPGGVGTLTTVILFENLMKAMDLQLMDGGAIQ